MHDDDYEDRIADDIEDEVRGMIEDEYNEQHRSERHGGSSGCGLITIIGLATMCIQVMSALES